VSIVPDAVAYMEREPKDQQHEAQKPHHKVSAAQKTGTIVSSETQNLCHF
jgi:hypothetical protein